MIGENLSSDSQTFYVQNFGISQTTEYKYLGIIIESQRDYLKKQEKEVIATMNRKKGHVWHLARHSYNPYTVGKILWKTMAVPSATYANEVLCYTSNTTKTLERQQREVGRWILGGNLATANAAIEGEIAWSSFEYREARSKTRYLGRLSHMEENRYAKRVFHHVRYTGAKTEWIKRLARIDSKYSRGTNRHMTKSAAEWIKQTNKEMREIEHSNWTQRVNKKQSMQLYNRFKQKSAPFNHYRGDRQSGLLFQARTGSLLTRLRLAQLFDPGMDTTCLLCGEEEEDLEHVLLRCTSTIATRPTDADAATALGLTPALIDQDEQGRSDGGNTRTSDIIEATKRHLANWERQTRTLLRAT